MGVAGGEEGEDGFCVHEKVATFWHGTVKEVAIPVHRRKQTSIQRRFPRATNISIAA